MKKNVLLFVVSMSVLTGLSAQNNSKSYQANLKQLSDKENSDDQYKERRSERWGKYNHAEIRFTLNKKNNYDLLLMPDGDKSDSIVLANIDLRQWIPTVPEWVGEDKNLQLAALVTQEWTQKEVRFSNKNFVLKGKSDEELALSRLHLTNNSLQAGLWELALFADEAGEQKIYFHAWFDFPKELYESLFKEINNLEFKDYHKYLDIWHANHFKADFQAWRTVSVDHMVAFENKNQTLYPLTGEHKNKHQNILYPPHVHHIQQLLTDSTAFAAFVPPGIYDKSVPQPTQVGKLEFLDKIYARDILINGQKMLEFELVFHCHTDKTKMHLVMGGLTRSQIPVLDESKVHLGFQMPMGIGVHSFMEDYETVVKNPLKKHVFYAMLLDQDHHWMDSRELGIDGLLFYTDSRKNLHIWIHSIERHCFVGHYMVENF